MNRSTYVLPILVLALQAVRLEAAECVSSPEEVLRVCVGVESGRAWYDVSRRGTPILRRSVLGLVFESEHGATVALAGPAQTREYDGTWEQPWGEERLIRDRHRELRVPFRGDTPHSRAFDVVVRVFDEGFAFRYDYHGIQPGEAVAITDELTEFRLARQYQAWWFEAYHADRDEYLYQRTPLEQVTRAETPLTLESRHLYLSIHEAALVDYASMTLKRTGPDTLQADLMPWSDGVRVYRTGPFQTPWRTVLIATTPAGLADSRMELNLNEPNRLGETPYARPGKYVGIWWEMHQNRSTWASGPTHGATTANTRRYIDFAAKYGFAGVLVEGWNTGWDGDWIANGAQFSFTCAYPDFDLADVTAYARTKGVSLIGHNETAGAITNYESQMVAAFQQYAEHDVHTVKMGYVKPNGTIARVTPDGVAHFEWFAGQYLVRHQQLVADTAARYRIALDVHEPVKDTGLRRTYPNMMSREGARGQEFNAWGTPTNPPEHVVILPFTRLLAGPMDFTPGIFDITAGKTEVTRRVQSTLANQLALYVVIYSPLHMAADLPESYERYLDAFQFIRDVPTDWERSQTIDGRIGDYIVVVRQRRNGKDWFLGALTDEQPRSLRVRLGFLEHGTRYRAEIYRDAPEADYRTNPAAYRVERRVVSSTDRLSLALAPGGGTAVRFVPVDQDR